MVKYLLILAVALSCSDSLPRNGIVLGKRYEPERTYFVLMPIFAGKVMIQVPYTITDDEDFILFVENHDREDAIMNTSGRDTVMIYVRKSYWQKIKVGDRWGSKFGDVIGSLEDPHKKERNRG